MFAQFYKIHTVYNFANYYKKTHFISYKISNNYLCFAVVASASSHRPKPGVRKTGGPQQTSSSRGESPAVGDGAGDRSCTLDHSKEKLLSPDGTEWTLVDTAERSSGRRANQNVLREIPGPLGHARRYIYSDSVSSAWRLFIDASILTHVQKCTVAEARRCKDENFSLSIEELEAFIAIFYARGISGTNDHSVHFIWSNDWGVPFCKNTMARNRFFFFEILRYLTQVAHRRSQCAYLAHFIRAP